MFSRLSQTKTVPFHYLVVSLEQLTTKRKGKYYVAGTPAPNANIKAIANSVVGNAHAILVTMELIIES